MGLQLQINGKMSAKINNLNNRLPASLYQTLKHIMTLRNGSLFCLLFGSYKRLNIFTYIFWFVLTGMEEVEENIMAMRIMLLGDGDIEPNADQVSQLAVEVCNEGVIALFVHELPILGWEVSR